MTATFSNQAKNTATMQNLNKKGAGWLYEETDLLYEMADLYYESFGPALSVTNLAKNTATIKNLAKT